VILSINGNYPLKLLQLTGLCNGKVLCFIWRTNLKHYLDYLLLQELMAADFPAVKINDTIISMYYRNKRNTVKVD
jgi:hypothetical protein